MFKVNNKNTRKRRHKRYSKTLISCTFHVNVGTFKVLHGFLKLFDHLIFSTKKVINCTSSRPFADILQNSIFKNFSVITGKHLCWCLFLTKLQTWRSVTLLKRDSNTGVSCEYCEIRKNTYFEEHMRTAAFDC